MNSPTALSPSKKNTKRSFEDVRSFIGKRIEAQFDMSDGTSEWFGGIVQSCSSDGSEAVIFYDDGESYLLDVADKAEWRPVLPETLELPVAASTDTAEETETPTTSTAASSGGSAGESNASQSQEQNNDKKSYCTNRLKPGLSLRSLLHKLTGTSSKDISSEKKKNTTGDVKTKKKAEFHSPPSSSDGQNVSQQNTSLVIDPYKLTGASSKDDSSKKKKKTTGDAKTKKKVRFHLPPSSSDGQNVLQQKYSLVIDLSESSDKESSIVNTKDSSASKKRSLQNDHSTLDAADASHPTKKQKQDLPLSNHIIPEVHEKQQDKVQDVLITHKQEIINVVEEKENIERNVASMQKKVLPNALHEPNKSLTTDHLVEKHGTGQQEMQTNPLSNMPANDPKSPIQAELPLSTQNCPRGSGTENQKPRAIGTSQNKHSSKNSGDADDPFQRLLSDVDKECLASIGITTGAELLKQQSHQIVKNLKAWRKQKGLISYSNRYYKKLLLKWKQMIISATYNNKPLDGLIPRSGMEYLHSIRITTCAQLLEETTFNIVQSMCEWGKQHGLRTTDHHDCAALVNAWKQKIIEGPNYTGSLQSLVPDTNNLNAAKLPPIQHHLRNSGNENNQPTSIVIPPWTAPSNMGEVPIERVVSLPKSSPAKEYLESIGITTGTELLNLPTSFIAKDMNKWRANQGLHKIDDDNCAGLVNDWKRDAIPSDYNGPFIRPSTNQITKDRNSPSCPIPTAPKALVTFSTLLEKFKNDQPTVTWTPPWTKPGNTVAIASAIPLANQFLTSIGITTSEQLLSTPTSDIASFMNEWRNKNRMYELPKLSCENLVNNWKNQILQST